MRPRPMLDELAMAACLCHSASGLDDAGFARWGWRYLLLWHLTYRLSCVTPHAGKE